MAPRNELETKLVEAWQEALRISKIGIRDNFLSLGGDSLKAIKRDFTLVLELAVYKGKLDLRIQFNRFQYKADTIIKLVRSIGKIF